MPRFATAKAIKIAPESLSSIKTTDLLPEGDVRSAAVGYRIALNNPLKTRSTTA